jgi:hypothetical protein
MFARKTIVRSNTHRPGGFWSSPTRRAVGYTAEPLERRVLLSALAEESADAEAFDASDAVFARLQSHSLTTEHMEALGVAEVQWKGRPVYAKKNQWLVKLDLGRLPSPHIGTGNLVNDGARPHLPQDAR